MIILELPLWNFFKNWHQELWPNLDYEITDYLVWLTVALLTLVVFVFVILEIIHFVHNKVDASTAVHEIMMGKLIDKQYKSESNSSSSGTVIVPNASGGIGVGLISSNTYSEEEFLLFVNAGKVYKIEVDMQQYYSFKEGDVVKFVVTIGGLSKKQLCLELSISQGGLVG